MRAKSMLRFAFLIVLLAASCGEIPSADLPKPPKPEVTLQKPEVTPQRPSVSPQRPGITPSAGQPQSTPGAAGTLAAKIPTLGGTLAAVTVPPVTVTNVTRIAQYDAAQMISTFATQYLGTNVTVTRAGGARGDVNLPSRIDADVNAAVSLSGQTVLGLITLGGATGGAQVAVGSGSISGDLSADISGASLGAFSVIAKTAPPQDATASLALVRQYYPALAKINLQQQSTAQGTFVFYAATTHSGVDWKTKQATAVAEAIVAGTTRQGASAMVWVVIGNGTFATSVKP